MTNGDKGGRGVKNRDFDGDILFEWPPTYPFFSRIHRSGEFARDRVARL